MHSTGWIRGFSLVVALVASMTSCAPTDETEPQLAADDIIHGHVDRTADPAVMALMIGNDALCSATLIAPRAVLTARHCVSEIVSDSVDCTVPGRQIESDRAASSLALLQGSNVATATLVARGARLLVPSSDRLCNADVAIVLLDRAVEGITPLQVDLTRAPRAGDTFSAVGFGRRSDTTNNAGLRERRDNVPVLRVAADEILVGQAICSGDSGGPALETRTGMIMGVVSRGSSECTAPDASNIYSRVTPWAALIEQGIRLGGG